MTTGPTADTSARAIISSALSEAGLSELSDWAWGLYLQGTPLEQIMLELPDQQAFKTRYPAYQLLAQQGHAISVAQYRNLEETYTQLARQYGLPQGFYDQPDDFTKLIAGEVSPTEFQSRLQDYQTLAFDTDPTARSELQRLYGIGTGDIAAYFIDPARALPLLQRQFGAAEVGAASQRSGYGGLSQAEAELLSNISPDQAAQGFGQLVDLQQVLGQLPGDSQAAFGRDQALSAVFQGNEVAKQEILARQKRRLAPFEEGGQYTTSQQGISGVA